MPAVAGPDWSESSVSQTIDTLQVNQHNPPIKAFGDELARVSAEAGAERRVAQQAQHSGRKFGRGVGQQQLVL